MPRPALVVLDLNLPRRSGLEVLGELNANEGEVQSRAGLQNRQRGAVQPARADALTRWHSLPILLAAYRTHRTPGSCLANEWPTNDLELLCRGGRI
jgi:DNA-binding response OmpR family regulator